MTRLRGRLDRLEGGGQRSGVYVVRTEEDEREALLHAARRGDHAPVLVPVTPLRWIEPARTSPQAVKRKDLQRKIWDKIADQVYRPVTARGMTFEVYQPWLRGIRFGGALGDNSYYYEWGDRIAEAWLDK